MQIVYSVKLNTFDQVCKMLIQGAEGMGLIVKFHWRCWWWTIMCKITTFLSALWMRILWLWLKVFKFTHGTWLTLDMFSLNKLSCASNTCMLACTSFQLCKLNQIIQNFVFNWHNIFVKKYLIGITTQAESKVLQKDERASSLVLRAPIMFRFEILWEPIKWG
jgi:hypothetical protein